MTDINMPKNTTGPQRFTYDIGLKALTREGHAPRVLSGELSDQDVRTAGWHRIGKIAATATLVAGAIGGMGTLGLYELDRQVSHNITQTQQDQMNQQSQTQSPDLPTGVASPDH